MCIRDRYQRRVRELMTERCPKRQRLVTQQCSTLGIPTLQFGTYRLKGPACTVACVAAFQAGYRGVDTASIYNNEKEVGAAIRQSNMDRGDVFVQSKLWRSHQGSAKVVRSSLKRSLSQLGLEYLDLWLLHWPGPGRYLNKPPVRKAKAWWRSTARERIEGNDGARVPAEWTAHTRLETWSLMADQVAAGTVRHIGVANFSAPQLRELLEFCDRESVQPPAVVQNECHPYLNAQEVRKLCHDRGIQFQAYSSLGSGAGIGLMDDPVVVQIAQAHRKTAAQVLLRWAVQHGCAVIPKASSVERICENSEVLGFELERKEMEALDRLNRGEERQTTMATWLREFDPSYY
eukprot:TRINITY_DN20263_c0_g1_i1.p1 TRINITY_DN20263_c0_g1~~TRINITY_DN20263_c0_g1_i1.p1  ORF type:complete len:347 (-),score=78.32 TRINITY_DN20263_c0_g1_i1:76-1116(-)